MKKRIINLLKYNKGIYNIYFYIMSFILKLLKLFVKTDNKLILFNSFAGRKYDDSPKEIYEEIIKDDRFKEYKIVWAFHNPEKHKINGAKVIKTDTLEYFITALKSRVWITNSSVERGLDFKNKNTFYLNTWHGTPLKKMGSDIQTDNKSFKSKSKNKVDTMNAQSDYEANIFSRVFNIPRNHFLEVGLPRNDKLINYSCKTRSDIRARLDIPSNKKVILYAPTFREYEKDKNNGCVLKPPMNLKKWENKLSDEYILLFRAHYEVSKVMEINNNYFVRDMTNYNSLNDLMIASDILVSDYSSIFFDYSLMNKPMLYFTYDYEKYSSHRGMYFDIREHLNGGKNEDEIINILKNIDVNLEVNKTIDFKNKFVNYSGDATKKTIDYLYKVLN